MISYETLKALKQIVYLYYFPRGNTVNRQDEKRQARCGFSKQRHLTSNLLMSTQR